MQAYAETTGIGPESCLCSHYDVLVVGGGPAGVVAAIQAAAAGAQTLLLERSGMLGGTMTNAGVNFPGLFHAWGHQVIAGYGWKLVAQCVAECGETLPDFGVAPARHWQQQVRVNRAVFGALCDEAVLAAGATILFHAMLGALTATETGWRATLCTKTGLVPVVAGVVLDCTGDANAVELAGGELQCHDSAQQPGSLCCVVSGYDLATLDIPAINAALVTAIERGEVSPHDVGWDTGKADIAGWLRHRGQNANHICGIDARTSCGRSRIEIAGRQAVLRVCRFLRRQPGLENLRLDWLAAECGVRETATIVGEASIGVEDYSSGRVWADALCHSFYPIDLHTAERSGLDYRPLAAGKVPTVPRGALLPRGLRRIAVAGRCVSSDRLANSALRVQASAMAMGQAAGAMAALSAQAGLDLRDLPLTAIRKLLAEHGAIVPG